MTAMITLKEKITHAVMVMAEAESGQLTAEITDRGDKRCIAR